MLTRELIAALTARPSSRKREVWDAYVEALLSDETRGRLGLAGIGSELRLAHLLAQWLHESGGFTVLWEDMSYSAKRISQIFGEGRHSAGVPRGEAVRLAGQPEALAERVYGLGNPKKAAELGNREPGDGYRYRGFGIGQLTGRRDHERLLKGETTAQASINAAIAEWSEKGCNALADKDDIVGVTKKINGGQNGLEDRKAWLVKCKSAVAGMTFDGAAPKRAPAVVPPAAPIAPPTPPDSPRADTPPVPVPAPAAPSLPAVAMRSKSVWALVNAKIMVVVAFLTDLGRDLLDWLGHLFGAAPAATGDAIGLAEQGSKLSALVGFNWQKVGISVVVVCLGVALVRHIRDKRELETLRGQQS